MIQYHPVITTFLAFFLGTFTGVLVSVIARINWLSLGEALFKKTITLLREMNQTSIKLVIVRKHGTEKAKNTASNNF